jgi:hypothetical protein
MSPSTLKPSIRAVLHQAASVRYQATVRDAATGQVVRQLPWRKNLIMDAGLDRFAQTSFVGLFAQAMVGTGTNPVMRYSSPTTFTQSGNTVTSSAAFFSASDVGYLLAYGAQGSGVVSAANQQYITGYTNATTVTVSSSKTVGATVGAVWYVSQTTLQTFVKATSTYAATGNGTFVTPGNPTSTFSHTRIFIFSVEGSPITYNEIGWSWNGTNTFGRDLILPAGISLSTGQQLEVTLSITLQVSPTVQTAVADVSAGTWNTAGNAMIEYQSCHYAGNDAFSLLNSAGAQSTARVCLEPNVVWQLSLIEGAYTQQATLQTTTNPKSNTCDTVAMTPATYSPGTFTRTASTTIATGSLNGLTWYGVGLGAPTDPAWCFSIQLTTPNSKTSTYTLAFTFTITWGRILVN